MKTSEKFERQVARIHQLIDQPGSDITWNDRITDPDNPDQTRQIDITIKRDGKLTIVECRIHKEKQDVKWIEELMGRRASLKADAIIAVSSTGFTEGAIKKAKAHGVILRDFVTLSESEIKAWGHLTKVWLGFYQFKDAYMRFDFGKGHSLNFEHIKAYLESNPDFAFNIFETLLKGIEDELSKEPRKVMIKVEAELGTDKAIEGVRIISIRAGAVIQHIKQEVSIASVVAYASPDVPPQERSSFIEKTDINDFEITKDTDKNEVSFAVDLSLIDAPPNALFREMDFDFGRDVRAKHLEIFGTPRLQIQFKGLRIGINV